MNAKQVQAKHWRKSEHPCPHKTTLEMFWHRSGIKIPMGDETAIRTFRLEMQNRKGRRIIYKNNDDYALAA